MAEPLPFGALRKSELAHKYDHGHALVLTGGFGRTGAARLAARAALRVGAGLVTLGAPGAARLEIACQITSLMLVRIEDANDLCRALADPRLTALCLGPGMGVARAAAILPAALEPRERPRPSLRLVLDADALTALAKDAELRRRLHASCILTPHMGEFERLCPDLAEPAGAGGEAARKSVADAARRLGAHVILKGPVTRIASPTGELAENEATGAQAAPDLATAGSGDVLAGILTGLLARGLTTLDAMRLATWLHCETARHLGSGLIAEDLPEALPTVLREVCAS